MRPHMLARFLAAGPVPNLAPGADLVRAMASVGQGGWRAGVAATWLAVTCTNGVRAGVLWAGLTAHGHALIHSGSRVFAPHAARLAPS